MASATDKPPFDAFAGFRPVIHPARDLALPGRILRSVLALLDAVNPCADSSPAELEVDPLELAGWVAGTVKAQETMADGLNARRRAAWRARFGGEEPEGPMKGVLQAREPLRAVGSAAA